MQPDRWTRTELSSGSRETRLREKIDRLTDERDDARTLVKQLTTQQPRRTFGFCCLCGIPTVGRVCKAHKDLLLEEERPYRNTSADGGRSLDGTSAAVGRKDSR